MKKQQPERSKRMTKKKVVLVAMPGAHLLDVAGPGDVFALATKAVSAVYGSDAMGYEIILASGGRTKQVMTGTGIPLTCTLRVTDIDFAVDTLLIGGMSFAMSTQVHPGMSDWLRNHRKNIRRAGSICVGAFMLAKAGLLDNKKATTHWEYCEKLQYDYPQIEVDSNPFFVKDGSVYTSGGLTSGMDLALALVEEDLGREIAQAVARKLVLHLRRPGTQTQYGLSLPPLELTSHLVGTLHPWLHERLSQPLQVEDLAAQANMSVRNFSRVFYKETGLTPAKYLEKMRLDTARKFLSETDLSINEIADRCGLGGVVSMRRVFLRHLQITPNHYRNHFRSTLVNAAAR
jgi:transcriptional regulator GlxA family with amidase domain